MTDFSKDELIKKLQKELEEKNHQILSLESQLKVQENEEREEDGDNLLDKIQLHLHRMFPGRQQTPILKAELYLSAVNLLSTIYRIDYDEELDIDSLNMKQLVSDYPAVKGKMKQQLMIKASKIAFNYTIHFFHQLQERKLNPDRYEDTFNEVTGFPLQWLLGVFPTMNFNIHHITDTIWLPVHILLAYQPDISYLDQYLEDLSLILMEYGELAFQEEVSPLSIAVSKNNPYIEIIQKIIEFKPTAYALEDEDGSIPIHHACACNEDTTIIEYLYSLDKTCLEKVDNYGASVIHYATFSGHMNIVKYLLTIQPLCVTYAEGNGALPLHDAVQNCRGRYHQTEITSMLLTACPEAASKRDSLGAFPFHRAVKSSTVQVAQMLIDIFPKAVFATDSEGLLPIHYFSQRVDKDQQLDLLQYILELNPKGTSMNDQELFPKAVKATSKNPFSSFFGGSSSNKPNSEVSTSKDNNKITAGKPIRRKSIANRKQSIVHSIAKR